MDALRSLQELYQGVPTKTRTGEIKGTLTTFPSLLPQTLNNPRRYFSPSYLYRKWGSENELDARNPRNAGKIAESTSTRIPSKLPVEYEWRNDSRRLPMLAMFRVPCYHEPNKKKKEKEKRKRQKKTEKRKHGGKISSFSSGSSFPFSRFPLHIDFL